MSKYLEKSTINYSNFSNPGTKSYAPTINDELKSFIFSNIGSNYQILYDKITPDVKLTFTDSENNSVTHKLISVDDKLVSEKEKIELLKFFISRGAPINTYNKEKLTPLHIAIINGNFDIVEMLIRYGANVNAETNNKMLPIHLALRSKINACEELVIPKEFFKDDRKDKNELAIAVIKRIKECFDPKWIDIFNAFFVYCGVDETVNDRIADIQNNIQSNDGEVNSNILKEVNSLIENYKRGLHNIYEDNDQIDTQCITDPNAETGIRYIAAGPPRPASYRTNDIINFITPENVKDLFDNNINDLRTLVIKDLYNRILLPNLPVLAAPAPAAQPNPNFNDELDDLFIKYNPSGQDLEIFKQETIITYANRMIVNLIDYYKTYYAYEILRNTTLGGIKQIDDHLKGQFTIDVLRLKALDMRKNPADPEKKIFMNEIAKKNDYMYNYNYNSTNEAYQCYRNNVKIIKLLLKNSNYLSRDSDGNTILHYLIKLENYNLFKELCEEKFDRLFRVKNNFNLTPIDVINNRIKFNINNFYGNDILKCEPLFADIYSSNLMNLLKNNGELLNIIPENVNRMFYDLFTIYNLEDVNTDIFNGRTPPYAALFNYDKRIWIHSEIDKNGEIKQDLYDCILEKYSEDKNIDTNQFYKRFCNALVHTITLHFSSVFYNMIHKLLIDINRETLGFDEQMLNEFCRIIFEFDPTYRQQNLAQNIILNLYTYKYNSSISQNSTMTSLTFILEEKLNYIRGLIPNEPNPHYAQYTAQRDKIINYCNQYFDTFKDKIKLFLVNYVKFQELQYNLQKIKEQITR
jgi:ankyrin repeat protein